MKKNLLKKWTMATMSLVVTFFMLTSPVSAQKYWINGKWSKLPAGYVVVKSFDLVSEQITSTDGDEYSAEDISKADQKKFYLWKKAGNVVFAAVDSGEETVTEFKKSLSDYSDEDKNAAMDRLTRPKPVVRTAPKPAVKTTASDGVGGVALNVTPGQGRSSATPATTATAATLEKKIDELSAKIDNIDQKTAKGFQDVGVKITEIQKSQDSLVVQITNSNKQIEGLWANFANYKPKR